MTVEARRDRWLGVFCIGLVCWAIGFVWHWFRVSLWLLDPVFVPGMLVLYAGGLVTTVLAALRLRTVGVGVLVAVLALAMAFVNPGYRLAPKIWFAQHRPLFELARHTDPGAEYYGNPLPLPLQFLSANGNVSRVDVGSNILFFPQWLGIPDDAGGYLYSRGGSPAGADLYGRVCEHPTYLGDDWWMCNMTRSGL